MTVVAGIDIGSGSTKGVLLEDAARVIGRTSSPTGFDLPAAGAKALRSLLDEAGLRRDDLAYVAATGYGRYHLEGRDMHITDITCNARAGAHLLPGTRCIVDIGSQSSRAASIDGRGRVTKFKVNDRCAAGAGRFLERVAKYLELRVEDLGEISTRSKQAQPISSVCAVLAESEIINHVTEGHALEDIVMGAHVSIADRVLQLLRQAGGGAPVVLCGGVSQNAGMVRALEERAGFKVNVSAESVYAGALGAALLGSSRAERRARA